MTRLDSVQQVPTTDHHQHLQDALAALDAAFAPVTEQRVARVGGCTHCYGVDDLEVLAGPARLVPEELIPTVAAESIDHWDDFPTTYRRFTPRIVRALVTDTLHVDHGLIGSRLRAAGWQEWPQREREALETVWHAWWLATLHHHPGQAHVTDVLETVAVSTGALTPWLATWSATRTDAADQHLGDALDVWLHQGGLADLHLGFYSELPATPELLPWLLALTAGRIGAAQLAEVERIAYS
ncbi:hypothetical protein GCM10009738_08570 [Kitasatospora viridis]